jgi:hypothetical protein
LTPSGTKEIHGPNPPTGCRLKVTPGRNRRCYGAICPAASEAGRLSRAVSGLLPIRRWK